MTDALWVLLVIAVGFGGGTILALYIDHRQRTGRAK